MQKREGWETFRTLAARAERLGLKQLGAAEIPGFAAQYREVASDLARARTYGVDPRVLEYLERVVSAGHNALYGRHIGQRVPIVRLVLRELPAAVVDARAFVLAALLLFALPAATGYLAIRERPAIAEEVLPDEMIARARAGAGRRAEGVGYAEAPSMYLPVVASRIITNNVQVAFFAFAFGITAGIGTLLLLTLNGLFFGAVLGLFANYRLAGGAARRRGRAAPVPRGHDRRPLVGERRRPGLQVRRQRRVGGAPGVLFRERVELPQEPGQRSCARGGHRSHRHDPTLRRRRDHHRAGGENRGRCGRLTGSSVQGFEDAAHLARERLDLLQARDRLRVILVGAQQEQLGLGEDRGQGVRQVVAELSDGVQRVDHLEQRAVEIAEVMIPQVAHRLPQVRLRRGTEDLRGGALRLGVRRAEQDPPAPDSVLGPAYLEANGDELSVESDGGKVVDDRFGRIGCVVACRLSGHADPRAGLRKDIRTADLRNSRLGRCGSVWEVWGGWGRLFRSDPTSTNLHNLPTSPTSFSQATSAAPARTSPQT